MQRFYRDRCLEAAAALTYTSLLSLVPLFALMFAVLKGLGAQHRLEPLLLSRLSLDPEVMSRMLHDVVQQADAVSIGYATDGLESKDPHPLIDIHRLL